MMVSAPARRAAMIPERPTPPAPNTATEHPGSILARLMTAPTPVVTAHPTSAATSVSVPAGRGMQERALTTAWRGDGDRGEEGCRRRASPGGRKPPAGSEPAPQYPLAAPHPDRRP